MYGAEVHLVEHYTITLRGETLEVTDWALVMEDQDAQDLHDQAIVLVPAASSGSEVVSQEDDFLDDSETYREEWEINAAESFVNWLAIFRGEKPEVTVAKALQVAEVHRKPNCTNSAQAVFVSARLKVESLADLLVRFALSEHGCTSSQLTGEEARSKADAFIAQVFSERQDASQKSAVTASPTQRVPSPLGIGTRIFFEERNDASQ